MKKTKIFATVIVLSFFMFLLTGNTLFFWQAKTAKAASDTSVVVQPPKFDLQVSPGQKIKETFTVINRSNVLVQFKLSVQDFRVAGDNGKIEFYDKASDSATSWLVPQYLEISLKPLQTKDVDFIVAVPADESSGGHYGAIVFEPIGLSSPTNFGTLVMLTVSTPASPASVGGKVLSFSTTRVGSGNPVVFTLNLQNSGNTHLTTGGNIIIKNWRGQEIGNFATGDMIVYPGANRVFQWQWNGASLVNFYTAEIQLSNPVLTQQRFGAKSWFIVFPWQIALVVLAGLAIGAFIGWKYRQQIIYKKWVGKIADGLTGFSGISKNNLAKDK